MENGFLREGERLDDLQCGGYRILQHPGLFRFGTDAVLLQNFARVRRGDRILDLGTGTGILPILLCAHHDGISADAVELQPVCADMAARSVALNGLGDRIRVLNMDIRDTPQQLGHGQYDLIVCNPPYFKKGSALSSPNPSVALARQEMDLELKDVVRCGCLCLKNGGRFALILPAERLTELSRLMGENHTPLKRVRLIHADQNACAKLVLAEGVKLAREGCRFLPPLLLKEADGTKSRELDRIYKGEKTVNSCS